MKDVGFLVELGIVLAAALVGGLLARAVRLPVLVGYLAAGIVVGPHTPGLIADGEGVQRVANVGIALLMFAVGVQFSLKELEAVRRVVFRAGALQIVGSAVIGTLVGLALGWGLFGGILLGGAIAMSSTAVMMRILEERGELGSTHGAVMLGVLVLQDLSLVLFIAFLPAMATLQQHGAGALGQVALSLLIGALAVGGTLLLATKLIPKLLERVTRTGSIELFLLTTVCLCFGAAILADFAGLGMALGAFLAGVVISESPYAHEIFSQVRPLRDVFASIFFVSIGMLLDPSFVAGSWPTVLAVVATIVLCKPLLLILGIGLSGWHMRTAFLVGLGLAQIGEFSFVLAMEGQKRGIAPEGLSETIVSAALITIFATPFLYGGAPRLYTRFARVKRLRSVFHRGSVERPEGPRSTPARVLILGGGRVGRYTSAALRAKGVAHLIVDFDSEAISLAKRFGVPVLYGDATSALLLERAHPERAELAVVALAEASATEMAVKALRQLAPNLRIVARVRRGEDMVRMRTAGATDIVHGEFEAGVETIRQSLDHLGFSDPEVDDYIHAVRLRRYSQADDAAQQ